MLLLKLTSHVGALWPAIIKYEPDFKTSNTYLYQYLGITRQRLINLGFFENVNVTTSPGSDKTKIIVNVDVVERPTGLFSIGGGLR